MARCVLGEKKVKKLREKTGLDVVKAFTRGNTNHRIDMICRNGEVYSAYNDGTVEKNVFLKRKRRLVEYE